MSDNTTPDSTSSQTDVGYSYGLSDSSTPWNPAGVQAMIDYEIQQMELMLKMHQDPSSVENYVFFLMNQYGGQVMGQQSDQQNTMNKYFANIQQAWDAVHNASSPTVTGTGSTQSFNQALQQILNQVANDPFFKENSDNEAMSAEIVGNINSLLNLVNGIPSIAGCDKLHEIWMQYDPSRYGITGQQGNTTIMDQLNQSMGQINQQFTGESQAVGAITQSDAKTNQSESDALTNFEQAIITAQKQLVGNQVTH